MHTNRHLEHKLHLEPVPAHDPPRRLVRHKVLGLGGVEHRGHVVEDGVGHADVEHVHVGEGVEAVGFREGGRAKTGQRGVC